MTQREIEFRFFRKSPSPKMIYPECDFLVNHLGTPMAIVRYPNKIEILEVDVIPLQYTGLKDKNGKKIYEGDILDCKDRLVYIEWHNEAGCFDAKFIRYIRDISSNGCTNQEFKYRSTVIGNIYENPELLNPNT